MSEGPHDTPPSDTPPPGPPAAEPPAPAEPAAWEPAPAEPPAADAPAAESQAPGGYYPPPSEAPAAPAPRRGSGPLVAIIVVVVIVIVGVLGYGIGGYVYANSQLNSATTTYNTAINHANSLTDTVRALSNDLQATNVSSGTTAQLQADKTTFGELVTKSQAAEPQISADDAALAKADDDLKQNSWLTILRKSEIDKASTRIGHLRAALAVAKTLTSDYVQFGTFYQSLVDVVLDIDTVGSKASAEDLAGANAATNQLKADTDKAISLDKAPGLPTEVDALLQAIKTLANDFSSLFTAIAAKDSAGVNRAESALQADVTKVEAVDYTKIGTEIESFYKPLEDQYNSEIEKANST